jgi:predicted lipoprotein with Yx(FWY)xxD motif
VEHEIFLMSAQFLHLNEPVTCAAGLVAALLLCLALIALAGCAGQSDVGSTASVVGDQQGGKVPYTEGNIQAASSAARAHCAQFGKKAQITQMVPAAEGGTIGFQCR